MAEALQSVARECPLSNSLPGERSSASTICLTWPTRCISAMNWKTPACCLRHTAWSLCRDGGIMKKTGIVPLCVLTLAMPLAGQSEAELSEKLIDRRISALRDAGSA